MPYRRRRRRRGPRPARAGAAAGPRRLPLRERLRLHWSESNRFPGAGWSISHVALGIVAPFALILRYSGMPGAWPPVWLPLLDPLVHLAACVALLVYFCRSEGLDAWHLGLDRARIDARAGWAIALASAAALALSGALALDGSAQETGNGSALSERAPVEEAAAEPFFLDEGGAIGEFVPGGIVQRAPEAFAPARALQMAARYRPGEGTRAAAIVFAACRAGGVAAAQEIFLTGLLFPALRRRWSAFPAALACAVAAAAIHARPAECGLEPCLAPALQAASVEAGAAFLSALGYEAFRTLWLPVVFQAGLTLARMAPGLLPAVLG
jgi:hypothetical protein